MKRLTQSLLGLLLVFSFAVSAQEYTFKEQTLAQCFEASKKSQKPILIMLHASWCPHCKVMKKDVLPDNDVQTALAMGYVFAGFDADTDQGKQLVQKYNPGGFPAFLVLDAQGNLLYGYSGEKNKTNFLKELELGLLPDLHLPNLKSRSDNDSKNAALALNFIQALRKANQPTQEFTNRFLMQFSENDWITTDHWKIIANGITDISSSPFVHIVSHSDAYAKVSSKKRVEKKIQYAIDEALRNATQAGKNQYEKQRLVVASFGKKQTDSLLFGNDLNFYKKIKDWDTYSSIASQGMPRFGNGNSTFLKSVSETFLSTIDDKLALQKAIQWAEELLSMERTRDNYLLKAKLEQKIGAIADAKKTAQDAVNFCEEVGFDPKLAQQLLDELGKN